MGTRCDAGRGHGWQGHLHEDLQEGSWRARVVFLQSRWCRSEKPLPPWWPGRGALDQCRGHGGNCCLPPTRPWHARACFAGPRLEAPVPWSHPRALRRRGRSCARGPWRRPWTKLHGVCQERLGQGAYHREDRHDRSEVSEAADFMRLTNDDALYKMCKILTVLKKTVTGSIA